MGLFSKLFNAFKGMRLNKENYLTGKALDHVLIGSMYAEQQSAYLNSYETGLPMSTIKKLVEEYWDIYNSEDALAILEDLHTRNAHSYVDVVFEAYEQADNYVELFRANLPADEAAFNYYVDMYRALKNVVPELIEQKFLKDFSDIRTAKNTAWNYGRAAFLARCCYDLGYLSELLLKQYLSKSYQELKAFCPTWKVYTQSYVLGRALWAGANSAGMNQIAEDLLNHAKSPLKDKVYL